MSNIVYHELRTEESGTRRPSLEIIPKSGAKRTLLCLGFTLSTAVIFMYMRQPMYTYEDVAVKANVRTEPEPPQEPIEFTGSSMPQWTWICEDERCKRVLGKTNSGLQSLETCNMLCTGVPIWPAPTIHLDISRTIVAVHSNALTLKVVTSSSKEVTEYLKEAFDLFKSDVKNVLSDKEYLDKISARELLVGVSVEGSEDPRLKLDTKEDYKLVLKTEGIIIKVDISAKSFCGARHGFETLSQLIWYDSNASSLVTFEGVTIEDAPKFHYRGLLLDTARNFFPVKDIMRTIDAMAATKLNTFHWHATDSQSFPLELKSVPQLAKYGAYGSNMVYSTEDVKAIVHRARVRGIRVLIEIDAPAHVGYAWSWGPSAGLGDLVYCTEAHPWRGICGEPPCGQLNPRNDHVHELIEKIYTEIIELTGVDDVFHVGGDEVNDRCWHSVFNDIDVIDARFEFQQKTQNSLINANKGKLPELTILWSSHLTRPPFLDLLKNYNLTIQVWGGSEWEDMKRIPDDGFRTIISHVNAWYFDCGFGSWMDKSEEDCGHYRKWTEVYQHRPWSTNPLWKVEGGEACMWSELLGPEGLDARLWPRGAALGERLWSDPDQTTQDAFVRIDMQRERYWGRGVGAEVIWPRWCTDNPYECL